MSRPRLSVVIPAKDEGRRIADTVIQVKAALEAIKADGYEIVVVDDGSTDDTSTKATDAGADIVVRLATNRGKGAAVRAGVAASTGSVVAYTDADLSYAPDHLLRLLEVVEGGCAMAVGSRRHPDAEVLVETSIVRRVTGKVFNAVVALLVLGELRDTQCGVKAFSADVAHELFGRARIDGFAFDVEIFALAADLGVEVCEVPVRLVSDDVSTVRVASAARQMLRDLLAIRRRRHRVTAPVADAEGAGGGR